MYGQSKTLKHKQLSNGFTIIIYIYKPSPHLRLLSLLSLLTFLRREMGNCQAVETATTVAQRPDGKLERVYSTVTASEVIKSHPGHHVALLISSGVPHGGSLRFTRIKLLPPSDSLLLGHVDRLISSEGILFSLTLLKNHT